MGESAISRLVSLARDANLAAAGLQRAGQTAVRVLGHDAPYDLVRATGLVPVRLVANAAMSTPAADEFIGRATLSQRGRSLLEQLLAAPVEMPIVITHADSELPQIFAALRELMRNGDIPRRQVHFLDLLHLPRTSSRDYNRVRIGQFCDWLEDVSGNAITPVRWQTELSESHAMLALLQQARQLRDSESPRIAGEELCAMTAAAHVLPAGEWGALMQGALDEAAARARLPGTRLIIAGGAQFDCRQHQALSAAGFHVAGDLTDWGDTLLDGPPLTGDWIASFSLPERRRPLALMSAEQKAAHAADSATRNGAAHVVFLVSPEDEPSAWDAGIVTRMLRGRGLKAGIWRTWQALPSPGDLFAEPAVTAASAPLEPERTAEKKTPRRPPPRGQRSRKALRSVATFNAYQKEWFADVRDRVRDGSALGVVNANSPQEMIRAIGIPFVVNQWWASIVAAKQQSVRYAALLERHGYPSDVEAYSSQGLAAAFDDDAEHAPWAGLPRPDVLQTILGTDATPRIYDHWARELGADLFIFERTVEARLDIHADWWARMPEHWDEELEPIRLDLLTEELKLAITAIEKRTGKRFDAKHFEEVMTLVNEQEEYYRLTRDLIAQTHPAPVSIVDTMPATMVPQWHRGTVWARDAAKSFYEEVKGLVDSGSSVCADERLRLMWVGRGIWSNMGFYQRWQESHGAVFVWSMYLGLAADGYIRYFDRGRDPLRALAARFVTMGDELRMPTWAGAWYVKEAKTHGVHGAVALSDADPFVLRALRKAGIPVLALDLDNYQQDRDSERTDQQIGNFLDTLS